MTVFLPIRLCFSEYPNFCIEIDNTILDDELNISISNTRWARPMGSLLFGGKIREVRNKRRMLGLRTTWSGEDPTRDAHGYLKHIGFFKYFGATVGREVGSAQGSSTYLPITKVDTDSFTDGTDKISSKVQIQALRITNLLGINPDPYNPNACVYAFREIMRNVFEHSGANFLHYTVQKYYENEVEIGIIDEGIGILKALQPKHEELDSDEAAIIKAIKPGVSAADLDGTNENDNSGYGLYVLSRLAFLKGEFVIASGESAISLARGQRPKRHRVSVDGTFVGIRFNTIDFDFDSVLKRIIRKGELVAGSNGDNQVASKSSRNIM